MWTGSLFVTEEVERMGRTDTQVMIDHIEKCLARRTAPMIFDISDVINPNHVIAGLHAKGYRTSGTHQLLSVRKK